jgi:hypothetical protein
VKKREDARYLEVTKVEGGEDEEIETAIKNGRAAFVSPTFSLNAVFIPKDDDVLVVFLPERTDSRPWAPYVRVPLIPLGIAADIVCSPLYAATLALGGILSLVTE